MSLSIGQTLGGLNESWSQYSQYHDHDGLNLYHAQLQDAEPMRSEMDTSKLSSSRASQLLSRYAEVEAFDTWDNLQDPLALAIDPGLYGCDSYDDGAYEAARYEEALYEHALQEERTNELQRIRELERQQADLDEQLRYQQSLPSNLGALPPLPMSPMSMGSPPLHRPYPMTMPNLHDFGSRSPSSSYSPYTDTPSAYSSVPAWGAFGRTH